MTTSPPSEAQWLERCVLAAEHLGQADRFEAAYREARASGKSVTASACRALWICQLRILSQGRESGHA